MRANAVVKGLPLWPVRVTGSRTSLPDTSTSSTVAAFHDSFPPAHHLDQRFALDLGRSQKTEKIVR
jgi:hypothetical protein